MSRVKIYKEYGTGAGGRNHPKGGGNLQTSPRPFHDDEEEVENYTNKNVYGAEGGQRVGDTASYGNKNRDPRGGMFEIDADDYGDATLTTQGQMKSKFTKTGRPPGILQEKSMEDIARDEQTELQKWAAEQFMIRLKYEKQRLDAQRPELKKPLDAASKAFEEKKKALLQQYKSALAGEAPEGGGAPPSMEETIKEYFKDTKSNLMERMDFYRKETNRLILLEGAMMKFFKMFDEGMTNEEIIQDYATKGTQVPESFVGTARKQYESYKKLKLELDMSEKEFKNSAKEIINNPEEAAVMEDPDSKQLASGLFKEETLKNQIRKELNKIK